MAEAVDKALFIPADEHALTPNGLAVDAEGNFYVTSAFTGTIASYGPDGTFVDTVVAPAPGDDLGHDGPGRPGRRSAWRWWTTAPSSGPTSGWGSATTGSGRSTVPAPCAGTTRPAGRPAPWTRAWTSPTASGSSGHDRRHGRRRGRDAGDARGVAAETLLAEAAGVATVVPADHTGLVVGRVLADAGVETVFFLPGGHIAPVVNGCARAGIRTVSTRHEPRAVHMAEAWARCTGRVGVAAVTAKAGLRQRSPGWPTPGPRASRLRSWAAARPLGLRGRGAVQDAEQEAVARVVAKWARR